MFNSYSKFKQLSLAEKARSKFRTRSSGVRRVVYLSAVSCLILIVSLSSSVLLKRHVLNFVPDPQVYVRVPCTDPEIYFTRYSLKFLVAHFFLESTCNVRLK